MLNKVIAYHLLTGDAEELSALVNKAIAEGWVPSGTPIMSDKGLVQALVQFG